MEVGGERAVNQNKELISIVMKELQRQLPLFEQAYVCKEHEFFELTQLVLKEILPCIQTDIHEILTVFFEGMEEKHEMAVEQIHNFIETSI